MIVPMSKMTLIGLNKDKENLLEKLILMGFLDISDISHLCEEQKNKDVKSDNFTKLQELEFKQKTAKDALMVLNEYTSDNSKSGLFSKKKEIGINEFSDKLLADGNIYSKALDICRLKEQLDRLGNEKSRLQNKIEGLKCWESIPFPFNSKGTRFVKYYMGTFIKTIDLKELKEELDALGYVDFKIIYQTGELYYAYIIMHREIRNSVDEILKKYSFNRIKLYDEKGTYAEVINKFNENLRKTELDLKLSEEKIKFYASEKNNLKILIDYLGYRISMSETDSQLFETENSFIITGYLPSDCVGNAVKELENEFFINIITEETDKNDESVPTLVKNNSFVSSFEPITEMYSTPKYSEIDPNAIMAPFYFAFFGMMVSDAGYGLVTALICLFITLKYKPDGMMGNIIKLIGLGGVSTLIWGIMFGGYFGDVISLLSGGAYNPKPILFNPMEKPLSLLILSLSLGALHIVVGLAASMYRQFKDGKILDPIFDQGSWILIIVGVGLLFVFYNVGLYIAIFGGAMLILTKGRNEKNIFMKILKGIGAVADLPSYFADILSYSRLLALGLSTGVIATVINTMGLLPGKSFLGYVAFAAIFLIGHTFNLSINLLGAYVHASRLQYIEFYGKFFEGGGKAYNPVKLSTNYIKIK